MGRTLLPISTHQPGDPGCAPSRGLSGWRSAHSSSWDHPLRACCAQVPSRTPSHLSTWAQAFSWVPVIPAYHSPVPRAPPTHRPLPGRSLLTHPSQLLGTLLPPAAERFQHVSRGLASQVENPRSRQSCPFGPHSNQVRPHRMELMSHPEPLSANQAQQQLLTFPRLQMSVKIYPFCFNHFSQQHDLIQKSFLFSLKQIVQFICNSNP